MTKPQARWPVPDEGCIKVNTDGATDVARRMAVTGVVTRNHLGEFIAARCTKFPGVADPFSIELLAVREAVLLAREKG